MESSYSVNVCLFVCDWLLLRCLCSFWQSLFWEAAGFRGPSYTSAERVGLNTGSSFSLYMTLLRGFLQVSARLCWFPQSGWVQSEGVLPFISTICSSEAHFVTGFGCHLLLKGFATVWNTCMCTSTFNVKLPVYSLSKALSPQRGHPGREVCGSLGEVCILALNTKWKCSKLQLV